MGSPVDISNLALAHLADEATVLSIDPPDGSAQAKHCSRFYPVARDALLEMHEWDFATKRALLAPLMMTPPDNWQYAYALPTDCLRVREIGDEVAAVPMHTHWGPGATIDIRPASMPFTVETAADGAKVLFTNAVDATIRYTARVVDSTKFSPLFVTALSYLLASYLAGPITKD